MLLRIFANYKGDVQLIDNIPQAYQTIECDMSLKIYSRILCDTVSLKLYLIFKLSFTISKKIKGSKIGKHYCVVCAVYIHMALGCMKGRISETKHLNMS